MKLKDFAAEMSAVMVPYRAPTNTALNEVRNAMRNLDRVSCSEVAGILATLACLMKDSGFSELDLSTIDEAADFICGEQEVV